MNTNEVEGVKVDHPFFEEIYVEKLIAEALRQQPIERTVTILADDYDGLKTICKHYREKCQALTAQRDELLAACKAWEYARKDGGISHADLYESAWKKTKAAIANAEK